jgi:hypothetical protein
MITIKISPDVYEFKRNIGKDLLEDEARLKRHILNQLNCSINVSKIVEKLEPYMDTSMFNDQSGNSSSPSGSFFLFDKLDLTCLIEGPINIIKNITLISEETIHVDLIVTCQTTVKLTTKGSCSLDLKHLIT